MREIKVGDYVRPPKGATITRKYDVRDFIAYGNEVLRVVAVDSEFLTVEILLHPQHKDCVLPNAQFRIRTLYFKGLR